jgi:hypothetical protein
MVRLASKLAQHVKRSGLLPEKSRYVVVFTDEGGRHVGVSTNTTTLDVHNLLVCALRGLNSPPQDVIDVVAEEPCSSPPM